MITRQHLYDFTSVSLYTKCTDILLHIEIVEQCIYCANSRVRIPCPVCWRTLNMLFILPHRAATPIALNAEGIDAVSFAFLLGPGAGQVGLR